AAQDSPVYKFVKTWGLALPLHPEYRTLPMLFYVPPLLPVMASVVQTQDDEQKKKLHKVSKVWDDKWLYDTSTDELWGAIDEARFPLKYLASLFSAGNDAQVKIRLKKLMAVRMYRRFVTVGDVSENKALGALNETGLTPRDAQAIYAMTSLVKFDERFVIPAAHREQALEMLEFAGDVKGNIGFGKKESVQRGL
ncbi:MAG: nitrate reductase subunit beta, partial [Chlamydiota bacterium]|nr:nitrate reductase subunit beta [Chlamydiota bacterium]